MAFVVKPCSDGKSAKNADISILSNFLAFFFHFFFLAIENFAKYYLHAKFQINRTIQTEITGGGREESALPQPYQSAKSPACSGLKQYSMCEKVVIEKRLVLLV